MVVKAQLQLSPVDLSMHSTHKAVYLAPANMHTNYLFVHSGCQYCNYKNHARIKAS